MSARALMDDIYDEKKDLLTKNDLQKAKNKKNPAIHKNKKPIALGHHRYNHKFHRQVRRKFLWLKIT
jgi:hypothetical protein